jgi:hypothetical protein
MAAAPSAEHTTDAYGEIVVVGGGCYGAYYVRQLGRAARAGAISWTKLTVVDRDPQCQVARSPDPEWNDHPLPAARVVACEWTAFFDDWLAAPMQARDAVVPSPLMPHLFFEHIARAATARWPSRPVAREGVSHPFGTPWERASEDGTSFVSHATWMCPINCIEPRICPHTRELRDWTMPASLERWHRARCADGESILGPFTFHCTHRAYGVGMVDKAAIQEARSVIMQKATQGEVRALVATASHCHGAAAILSIGPLA